MNGKAIRRKIYTSCRTVRRHLRLLVARLLSGNYVPALKKSGNK